MGEWQNPLPFRIVVMADLGSARDGELVPVTPATLDDAIVRIAPRAAFGVPDRLGRGEELDVRLEVTSIDSFHPDAIVGSIAPLARAVEVRAALDDVRNGRADAASLDGLRSTGADGVVADVLSQARADTLTEAVGRLDRILGAQTDEVLHHPVLQRLEGAWRGLRWLLEGVVDEAQVRVDLLACSFEELGPRFRECVGARRGLGDSVPPTAVLLDFDFDHREQLLAPLRGLAGHALELQAVTLASTGPALFGLKSLLHLTALPDLANRFAAPEYADLREFQAADAARWAALTVNRFLLRDRYTPGDVRSFAYMETADRAESWLWGRAVWLAGANLARSFSTRGHFSEISGPMGPAAHEDLPSRMVPVSETDSARSSVEVPLTEDLSMAMAKAGLTPLVGQAGGNAAWFLLLSNLFRPAPGQLSAEADLGNQLLAGHLSHYVGHLLATASTSLSEDALAAHIREGLEAYLGPAGDGDSISVEPVVSEEGIRLLRVSVRPSEGSPQKGLNLLFDLPLG
ncbi:MAG: type VI secretion system contractile sheath domain-containing protein [Planctomycetota bacterium]|jgi:type VI secretion system protein ImpC